MRKLHSLTLEPVVNWLAEKRGICFPPWRIKIDRLSPLPPDELPASVKNFRKNKRLILCCDGGGVRGIVTLHALKALEEHAGGRCIDLFDMFAGTSTGSIIAGALAWGVSVDDLIGLYRSRHREIFSKTVARAGVPLSIAAALLFLIAVGPLVALLAAAAAYAVATILLIPRYRSQPLLCMLGSIFRDDTLTDCQRDILITAKDTVRSETIYFTAFHAGPRPVEPESTWLDVRGTYKDLRLRDAIAASAASAPTYFHPVGRFIDGGVGLYNNVSYLAPVEALRYSARPIVHKRLNDEGREDPNGKWPVYAYPSDDQLYHPGKVIVLSVGTGKQINNMEPGEAARIRTPLRWAGWVIGEGLDDADEQQSYVARKELHCEEQAIEYRRFQIYFTREAIERLQAIDPSLRLEMDSQELSLDAVRHFDFLDRVGQAFGAWLREPAAPGNTARLDHDGIIRLGRPLDVKPSLFHIDVYAREVKEELSRFARSGPRKARKRSAKNTKQ